LSAELILVVVAGTVAGGFVSGMSGFAFGMVAYSIWAWFLAPGLMAPMVVFGSLLAQLLSLGAVRRSLHWRLLAPFLIGGAVGVPIGVGLLAHVDLEKFRATVGAVMIAYSLFMLRGRPSRHPIAVGRWADGAIGIVGGIMAGLAGLSGVAPTIWCTLRGWDKDVQRSVFQSFNLAMHVATLTAYAIAGTVTAELTPIFAVMAPAVIVPAWAGVKLYTRISESAFRRLVLTLLLLSGAVLLVSTATHR